MNRRMTGTLLFTLISLAATAAMVGEQALAQSWARDMFERTEHDFDTVPRGAKAEFAFELVNRYQEDVHIASVRSSCGCTLPRIGKNDLKTYERGTIVAEFNTRSFVGPKSAVITVVIDRPHYAEVQLIVKGNIRSDIVTEPGEIQFGEIERGTEQIKSVRISYAGRNRWEIQDVRSANINLSVKLPAPSSSGDGRISYEMLVRLLDTTPPGEFSDEIVLVTNDQQFNLVTIPVRGRILPPLLLPASVDLGTVKSGQTAHNRIIIKSKQEFAITKIECDDQRIEFGPIDGRKTLHSVPLTFSSGGQKGAFRQKITVHTTLPDDSVAITFVTGNVTE